MQLLIANYGIDQINEVDWHNSGQFDNPDASTRGTYYGVSSVPHVVFDGTNPVIGAGSGIYSTYEPIYLSHHAAGSKLEVTSDAWFDEANLQGTINVTVRVADGETITNPQDVRIQAAIYLAEWNRLGTIWHHLAMRMPLSEVLTISSGGEEQTVSQTFTLDPSQVNPIYVSIPWDWTQFRAVAFVQRIPNRVIIQAANAAPTYSIDVVDLDPIAASVTGGAPAEFDVQLTYGGVAPDDVDVSIDESMLPAGWDAELVWNSTTYPSSFTIPAMTDGQMENILVRVQPAAGPGMGPIEVRFEPATAPNAGTSTSYYTFQDTPTILFVDDDNGEDNEVPLETAITNAGKYFVHYDFAALQNPSAAFMSGFDAVVWNTGSLQTQTIGGTAQTELMAYLDQGGSLFVSSQGYLNHQGVGGTFSSNYLRLAAFNQDEQASDALGLAGDPIGDGLSWNPSPPFVDLADMVEPGAGAVKWLSDPTSTSLYDGLGIRYDSGTFRTVFMSTAFEGVPSGTADVLMGRILDWLVPSGGAVGVTPGQGAQPIALSLAQNAPNPFTGSTTVRFGVPTAGRVKLSVFDVAGRRVVDLVDAELPAGLHSASWDGIDASGRRVASGVYLYRIEAQGSTLTREMVHLK